MITTPIRPGTAARQGIQRPARDEITIDLTGDLTAWGEAVGQAMRRVTASLAQFADAHHAAVLRDRAHRDAARRTLTARIETAP